MIGCQHFSSSDEDHNDALVRDLTFVAVDVLHDKVGVDDGFRFEDERRCGHPAYGVETSQNLVGLGQRLAGGSDLFPDECHGTENSLVSRYIFPDPTL